MLQGDEHRHDGSMTTIHAKTPATRSRASRTWSPWPAIEMPLKAVPAQVASAVT